MKRKMNAVNYKLTWQAILVLSLTSEIAWAQQAGAQEFNTTRERVGAEQGVTSHNENGVANSATPFLSNEPLLNPKRVSAPPEEAGIEYVGVNWYPDINAGLTRDTNIFSTHSAEVADWMWSVMPSLLGRLENDNWKVNLRTGIEASRYQDNSSQDTDDYWLGGDAKYNIDAESNVYAGLNYGKNHEDRSSPNLIFGAEPTKMWDTSAYAGFFKDFGPSYLRLGVSHSAIRYSNVMTSVPGVYLNNHDRDRDVNGFGGRLGYRLTPTAELFLQATADRRDYAATLDDMGYRRNSDGSRVAIGMAFNHADHVIGEAYLGRMRQDYADTRLKDVSTAEVGASMRWHTSPWTTYKFSLDRTLEETVIPGASGYVATVLGAQLEHDLSASTLFTAGLTLGRNSFQGIARSDNTSELSVGFRHYLTPSVYVNADYTALRRNSDDINAVYSRNLLSLTVGTDFGARRRNRYFAYEERTALDLTGTGAAHDGVYIGAGLGAGSLGVRALGLRDMTPGNTDRAELGQQEQFSSLNIGYGKVFYENWYVGVEADVSQGRGTLSHTHPNPVEPFNFSVRKEDEVGLSLRIGYALQSGSLIYAHAGRVRATFDNTLENVDGYFERSFDRSGTRLGVGADVPVSGNVFLRMGYAYTHYDDYNFTTDSYDENYLNKFGSFNFGLGWKFGGGAQKQEVTTVDPSYLRGMYVGGQLAHGALNSDLNVVDHYHATGNDTLMADFGRMKLTGSGFLGYGYTLNNWYLGAEAEIDPGTATWTHERTTSGSGGRDFSVSKKGSYSYDVRLGYALPNGVLLYTRAGVARGRFNTLYERGNSGLVDRDDTLNGRRLGFGAELPINKLVSWRMDYVVTDYDTTPLFSSPGGNGDTLNIANSESQFRLGLTVRF